MVTSRVEIAPYDGRGDFPVWCMKMRAVLSHHKALIGLEADLSKWSDEDKKRKAEVDQEAFDLIILSLSDNIIRQVSCCKTPIEVWEKLQSLYANQIAPNLSYLKASLFAYKMNPSKTIDENLDEFLRMSIMLRNTQHALDDTSLVMILMNSIPDNFHVVKDAFQYTGAVPSYDQFCTALRTRELEIKGQKARQNSGLIVQAKQTGENNKGKSSGNNSRPKSEQQNSENKQSHKKFKCHYCGKLGHIRKNCRAWLAKRNGNNSETNLAADDKPNETAVIMTPVKEYFDDLSDSQCETVYMGNNQICQVQGIGNVTLRLQDGGLVTLTKVRFVPGLRRNLISLGALDDLGCSSTAENGTLTVRKSGKIILDGSKLGSIYVLNGRCHKSSDIACAAELTVSPTDKWHLRLAHMSLKGLKCLADQGCLGSDKVTDLSFCEPCVLAKHHRLKFSDGSHSSKAILDYVHADLWGPELHETHGGNKYFLCIVDDFSRMVWVYLLKSKDETYVKFKDWKTMQENQTGRKLKALRTDNGLEFCNYNLELLCKESGVLRHKTVRHTPQQNGVAERMNRTLLEKVRSMLFTSGLPKSFWGEALYTAAYVVNRSPNRMLNFKCPVELWSNSKPSLQHLRIFGCAAYAHTKEGKLDPRSIKCIFLGYQQPFGTKGYRLWEYEARGVKIIISRDVKFDEFSFPHKLDKSHISADPEPTITPVISFDVTNDSNVGNLGDHDSTSEDMVSDQNVDNSDQVEVYDHAPQNELENLLLARDRARREIRPVERFSHADLVYTALLAVTELRQEPETYHDAVNSKDSQHLRAAMLEEMESLRVNNTWVLTEKPKNQKVIQCRWLYKLKEGVGKDDPPRYKARLVAKGFTIIS